MSDGGAPGSLELVREFVNTVDLEDGVDELESSKALVAWMRRRGLMRARTATTADLEQARRVREALRTLLLANNGVSARKGATAVLDRAARRAGLEVRFRGPRGRMESPAGGVNGALGRLLALVAEAMITGTWPRLKACRAENCRWAFYDHARNGSRKWCSMAVCGNRAKARAYRSRRSRSPTRTPQRSKAPRFTSSAPR